MAIFQRVSLTPNKVWNSLPPAATVGPAKVAPAVTASVACATTVPSPAVAVVGKYANLPSAVSPVGLPPLLNGLWITACRGNNISLGNILNSGFNSYIIKRWLLALYPFVKNLIYIAAIDFNFQT